MYSRSNPSPRYRELLKLYVDMHVDEHMFGGGSLREHLPAVRSLVAATGSRSLVDYGSGKGSLYRLRDADLKGIGRVSSVHDYLGVEKATCYDPAVPEFAALPSEAADGVISTDVLEHVPQEDIPWVLAEMFSLARRFVFAVVASFPAQKSLPNGENAHATQQPPEWWRSRLREVQHAFPNHTFRFEIEQDRSYIAGKLFGRRKRTVITHQGLSPADQVLGAHE